MDTNLGGQKPENHNYKTEIIKEATCASTGIKNTTCSVCGYVGNKEEIPKTDNHVLGSWSTVTSPGCSTKGKKTARCNVCGTTVSEEIPAIGHKYSWVTTVSATCGAKGLKQNKCSNCGNVKENEDIPATGNHAWSSWSTKTSATCTSSGSQERRCYACSKTETSTISAKGHSYYQSSSKSATCTSQGYVTTSCHNCSYSSTSYSPKLGHDKSARGWGKWVCNRCGASGTY